MAETQATEESVLTVEQQIEAKYEARFEVWKAKDLAQLREDNASLIQEKVQKLYADWLEKQKPPSLEDIKVLLDQEYLEVTIKVPVYDEEDKRTEKVFVIRELPQAIERKFAKECGDKLKKLGPQLNAFVQKNMDASFEKTLGAFVDSFDSAFEIMAQGVVMILNPFNKKPEVTTEWVSSNISSQRMYSIILAQVEVNRLRDFFSRLSQNGQKIQTMLNPLDMEQLRVLVP